MTHHTFVGRILQGLMLSVLVVGLVLSYFVAPIGVPVASAQATKPANSKAKPANSAVKPSNSGAAPAPTTSGGQTDSSGAPRAGGAQDTIQKLLCAPTENLSGYSLGQGSDTTNQTAAGGDLYYCINKLYKFGIAIASVAAVMLLVIAGYLYISGSEEAVTEAKAIMGSTIAGLVILLISYIFLRTINPDLIRFKPLQLPTITGDTTLCNPEQEDCVYRPDGSVGGKAPTQTTNTSGDVKSCSQGIVDIPANVAGRTGEKACPTLIAALQELRAKGVDFEVTDAQGPDHDSICHKTSGTCADLKPKGSTNWGQLCTAVKGTGKFRILNEAKAAPAEQCGKFTPGAKWSGDHLHIVLQGGGGGNSVSGPTPGAIPGVSTYTGPEVWKDADWSNIKPELRTAFNQFNSAWAAKGNATLVVRQVYRPDEYARYIRALWEYDQLIKNKNPLADLYGCDGFRHITANDLKNLTPEQLTLVKQKIAKHGNVKGPACSSDHGQGIAFDVTPPSSAKISEWIDTALAAGLCHHINNDLPHFALKANLPAGTNCRVL